MNIFKQIVVLRDYSNDIKDKIVIYDYAIDFDLFNEDISKLRNKEGWTYEDLIDLLDSYGSYEMYNYDDFITVYY